MTCACSASYEPCDDGYAEIWREGHRTTRKEHRCYECGKAIPVGSSVCFSSSLYDGKWETWYRCPTCVVYAEYLSLKVKECPLWGHLIEYVSDAGVDALEYREFVTGKKPSEDDE